MSFPGTPHHTFSPAQPSQLYYSSTPPAPPPKPSATSTPSRGPPLPPAPPQHEVSELDGSTAQPYDQQPPQQTHILTVEPGWLPETIKEKTVPDLHAFLQDQSLQTALLSNPSTTHKTVPASEAALTPLIEANLQLSQSLLQLESNLSNLRESTQQRLLALRALEQQHRTKLNETETALQSFSPMALYQQLSASVQKQDSVVRALEESWLDDDGVASAHEVGEVVKRVREAKRLSFLRRERRARWDEGRVGGWR